MSDDLEALIEVLVEIHEERPASFGVVACDDAFRLHGDLPRLIWLPKSEIRLIHRQAGGASAVAIPRWLAEKKGLIDAVNKPDPNQGNLL
jgi:hypothetical protein